MSEEQALTVVMKVLKPFVRNEEKFRTANAESRIWEDLQVNSARFIDILLAFESEFDMVIDDTQAEGVVTVGDVARILVAYASQHPETVAAVQSKRDALLPA
jgi:acyl carrier protein